MKTQFIYNTSEEHPIYLGNFEVEHKECPFVPISRQVNQDISLKILTTWGQAQKKMHKVRFFLRRPMTRSEVDAIKSIMMSPSFLKVIIWAGAVTRFELECKEQMLDIVMPIFGLPLGDILNYEADMNREEISLISPSLKDLSGKERLLGIEEEMKKIGDAELTSFHRLTTEDIETRISRILDEGRPEPWISPDEVNILDTAHQMGYLEIPRRCELRDLSEKLNMPISTLNGKLRLINKLLAQRFLEKAKESLPP